MVKEAARHRRGDASSRPQESRTALYDEVTAKIIAQLEAGRFPWVQPWAAPDASPGGLAPGMPRNALTRRAYSGVNVLLLWGAVIEHRYPLKAGSPSNRRSKPGAM
jgi:antirestriction protein ArdC